MAFPRRREVREALDVIRRVAAEAGTSRLKGPELRRRLETFESLVDQVLPSDEEIEANVLEEIEANADEEAEAERYRQYADGAPEDTVFAANPEA